MYEIQKFVRGNASFTAEREAWKYLSPCSGHGRRRRRRRRRRKKKKKKKKKIEREVGRENKQIRLLFAFVDVREEREVISEHFTTVSYQLLSSADEGARAGVLVEKRVTRFFLAFFFII